MSDANMSDAKKNNARNIREIFALLLAIVALSQLVPMVTNETFVNPLVYDPAKQFDLIRNGFQHYCYAFGLILALVGAGVLLLNYNDKVETNPSRLTPEDED